MKCYFKRNPGLRNYSKRIYAIWKEEELFEMSDKKQTDQARVIRTGGWLSEVELDETKRHAESGESSEIGDERTVVNNEMVFENIAISDERVEANEDNVNERDENRMIADGLGDEIRIWKMLQKDLSKTGLRTPLL